MADAAKDCCACACSWVCLAVLCLLWGPPGSARRPTTARNRIHLYTILEVPEILAHLETFWPRQIKDPGLPTHMQREPFLFYKQMTVVTYEMRAKWIVQRCELLYWNPEWVRWKSGPLARLGRERPIVLGEGRPTVSALRRPIVLGDADLYRMDARGGWQRQREDHVSEMTLRRLYGPRRHGVDALDQM